MAGIRFIINTTLQGRKDSTASRIARNLANSAAQIGATAAVSFVKQKIYNNILNPADGSPGVEAMLQINSDVSPYKCSDSRYPARNLLMFEVKGKGIKILLWDVKTDTTFENTIVKTAVTKRKGTVKEHISAKDYSFTLSGSLINDSQYGFPFSELKEFIKLFEIEDNISVTNILINSFGVTKVVLDSASIPQSSSKYVNAVNFNMKLTGDEDIELTIRDDATYA